MKYLHILFILLTVVFVLKSCSRTSYKFKITSKEKAILGEKIQVAVQQINGGSVDSIQLYINNKLINLENNKTVINTSDLGAGKHLITVLVFVPEKVEKIRNSFEVFSNKEPNLYTYKIVNTYPHDKKAFTQGLEYYNGYLYETTGKKGKSYLRKVDVTTGKVVQQYDLSDKYFGEGMTIFNNEIFWLTWQARKGFVFDLETFELKREFPYNKSHEGWGLAHTNTELIKSDGTNKIWFLNTENQEEKRSIQIYTNKLPLKKLNELEFINNRIYANYWQKPLIAIINPINGIVESIINLKDLAQKMKETQKLVPQEDVLNGIAYDTKNNRLFVTGKHWNKLFEIELIKQ